MILMSIMDGKFITKSEFPHSISDKHFVYSISIFTRTLAPFCADLASWIDRTVVSSNVM